jgi:hypothetical protein
MLLARDELDDGCEAEAIGFPWGAERGEMMDELHLPPDLYWDARAQSDDGAWNWLRALVQTGRRTGNTDQSLIRSADKASQIKSGPRTN